MPIIIIVQGDWFCSLFLYSLFVRAFAENKFTLIAVRLVMPLTSTKREVRESEHSSQYLQKFVILENSMKS